MLIGEQARRELESAAEAIAEQHRCAAHTRVIIIVLNGFSIEWRRGSSDANVLVEVFRERVYGGPGEDVRCPVAPPHGCMEISR